MKLRITSTDTELSAFEVLGFALYFLVEINVEIFVRRPIYIGAALFLVTVLLLSNRTRYRVTSYVTWTILWVVMVASSITYSIQPSTTITALLTVAARGLVFVTILSRINSYETLTKVLKILIFVEFFNLLYVFSKVNILTIGNLRIGDKSIIINSDATWNSNSISAVAVACTIYALCLLRNNRFKHRSLMVIVVILYSVVVLLCGSRMGLLLLVGIPLAWLAISSNHRNFFFRLMGGIIAAIIVYYIVMYVPAVYQVLGRRIETLIRNIMGQNVTDGSIIDRQNLISHGLDWFKERPFFGFGMYTFKERLLWQYGYSRYAHNSYIEVLVGTGIVGIIVYYWHYIYLIVKSWRIKYNHWQIVLSAMLVIMVAEFATVSFKNFTFQFALCVISMVQKIGLRAERDEQYQQGEFIEKKLG